MNARKLQGGPSQQEATAKSTGALAVPQVASPIPIFSVRLDEETVALLAESVAAKVSERLPAYQEDYWFDSAEAADYLRMPLSQLRKLSAAGLIPAHQDTPGGRLYFLRSELDEWRRSNPASR